MSETVYKAIENCFAVSKDEFTQEQQNELKSFTADSKYSSLSVQPTDQSPNGISIKPGTDIRASKESLVFVKVESKANEKPVNDTKVVNHLRYRLAQCTTSHSSVMNVLSEMKKYSNYSQVMEALKGDRGSLLNKVIEWAENMAEIESDKEYTLVEKIAILKAREGKLKAVIKVSETLFNDIEGYFQRKKQMEQLAKELNSQSSGWFREWCESSKNVEINLKRQCIEIDTKTQVPRVTFDPGLVALTQQCRSLRCYGFVLPSEIVEYEEHMKKYGFIARELREIVNFYCTVGDQILLSQRPMLIEGAKAFTALLESKNKISWDKEPLKLRSWLDELKDFSRTFAAENRTLRRKHQQILQTVTTFFDIPPLKWRTSLNEIRTIMHDIDTKYSNTTPWKKHWDHQLYKILEYHFSEALIKSENWLGFGNKSNHLGQTSSDALKVDLCFEFGSVNFRPSFEDIKAKIFVRIKKFLSIPVLFQGFVEHNSNSDSFFSTINLRSFNSIPVIFAKAEQILSELKAIRVTFVNWTAIYHVLHSYGGSTLTSVLRLESLQDFKDNLMIIKSKSQLFNKEFVENELHCKQANIVVNLIPIKIFVEWLYIEVDKMLVRTLKEETENLAEAVQSQLEYVTKQLTQCPKNIDDFLSVEQFVNNELSTIQATMKANYNEFNERYAFLLKWSAKSAPNLGNIVVEYEEFERIFETRHSVIESFRELLKSKLEANIETLQIDIQRFSQKWKNSSVTMKEDKGFVSEMKLEVASLNSDYEMVNKSCDYFSFKKPEALKTFEELKRDVDEVDTKLNLFDSFEAGFSNFFEMEWIVSRNKLSAIENYLSQWEEENPNCGSVMKEKIKEWRDFLSILKLCRGECFVKTHWDEFLTLLRLNNEVTFDSLKLHHLVAKKEHIFAGKEKIKELNARSVGEMSVRETFNELDAFAASSRFDLYEYKTSLGEDIKLIKSWRTVMNQISESILSLQSLKQSEYFSNEFAEKRVQWEERLTALDAVVSLLNTVQRKWTYLEPIYAKNQSPGVFSDDSFSKFSQDFQNILRIVENDSHVVRLLRISGLEVKLRDIDNVFNGCQKKLSMFMEQSRNRFPRFYFLADDDLLLVLAGKADISQAGLLKKLFNNSISKLHVDNNLVFAIESPEGEIVTLTNKVFVEANEGAASVERWLTSLETEIKTSLKSVLFNALKNGFTLENIDLNLPSQICSLLLFISFTSRAEEALKLNTLLELKTDLANQLGALTKLESEDQINKIKAKSLIMDTIHFVSVVDVLLAHKVDDCEDWYWQKQLRYYANVIKNTVEVRMGNSAFQYSFEYLGTYGVSKLVYTPLTDKCYLICMQAMSMGLGGNPYGPAGTGKTESIKALGQQLGRQVLVFNCDEAIDIKSMVRILIGLIKCGFWGCFDEFNRLQIDVLSALSSQIQAIQNSLKTSSKTVTLFDEAVEINSNCGIFITLNPVGKQYKGRNRLPDNLKALFLPISMTIPNSALISNVLLLAEGFDLNSSKDIGDKIFSWFELCKFGMSQQKHYDWGLRAIKSCLLSSGRNLKYCNDEVFAVITALRKQIKSKLVEEDGEKFEELICDVFGDKIALSGEDVNHSLRIKVVEVFKNKNLVANESQISKLFEFDEQLKSRLGVVILGDTGVGKSTLWKLLIDFKLLTENITIIPVVINPKSVTRSQLLGFIDEDTREWQDGVFACKAREVTRDDSSNKFWLIFDGDIDPEWVEALNSVLDDNKVLTLPSGERIDFDTEKVNIIFETNSLRFASPATISRLGVVSIGGVKSKYLIQSTLNILNAEEYVDLATKQILTNRNDLQISYGNTLLSQIKFAIETKKNVNDVLNNTLNSKEIKPYKNGNIVVTSNVLRVIDFMSAFMNESMVLIGDRGVGKNAILSETVLKTGHVLRVNCHPKIMPHEVIAKIREVCIVVHIGSQKVLKTSDGSKLIVYVRHLELVEMDKWHSKYLIEFLTNLVTYKGIYDESTLDWILVDNFQVVATCISLQYLNSKFLSLLHIVTVTLPPSIEELKTIFEMSGDDNSTWKSNFASGFIKVIKSLKSNNKSCDYLRSAMRIMEYIGRHSETNDVVLFRESFRGLQFEVGDDQRLLDLLSSSFGSSFPNEETFFCETFGSKITRRKTEEFYSFARKSITKWINESEALMCTTGVIPEFADLFSELSTFLSDPSEGVQGVILLGHSGMGRKLCAKVLSLHFAYDLIWTPKHFLSEKQITAEFNSFFEDDCETNKKILILVDDIQFQLIPSLIPKIYDLLHSGCKTAIIKVVIAMQQMSEIDHLMWSRVCNIYRVQSWNYESQKSLAKTITDSSDNFVVELFADIFRHSKFLNDSRRFLSFVDVFKKLLSMKTSALNEKREHLLKGFAKLEEASNEVQKLKEEAKEQQTVLAAKRMEADDALNLITSSMQASEGQKEELEDIKAKTEKETAKLKIRKEEIDAELKEIEPTLLAAKAAVGGIKNESLAEIRSLRAPPEVIRDILEGVLRLMGVNDTSWVSMKSFLSRRGVKEEIMNFDARKITPEMRVKVESLMKTKAESFEEQQAKRASAAALPLAIWLKANVTYSKVLHKIKPLEEEQNKLESGLRSAQSRMKSLTGELQGVELEVGNLRNRLNQVTIEAAQIEVNLKQTTCTLTKSESLITELSGEFVRWKEQLSELDNEFETLPQQCLVASAYINFTGIESSNEERMKFLEMCSKKVKLNDFKLSKFLNCDSEDDAFISVQSSFLTPLIVDPMRKFISKVSNATVVDLNKQDWQRNLELSLRFGKTVVIDGFAELNLALLSLLRHEIFGTEGSRQWIFLGDKRVDYNPNFSMFLVAPDISQEILNNSLINVVNLAPSNSSTAAMLLSMIIEIRRPELEQRKAELEKSNRVLESKLMNLESELLLKLSSSSGNILNNDELIASLKEIKKSTNEIQTSLKQSASIGNDLNKERVQYEPLAQFASKLYFDVRELFHLNHMYRFGMLEYQDLFVECLKSNRDLTNDRLLQCVFSYVSNGLFPEDKTVLKRFLESRYSQKIIDEDINLKSFLTNVHGSKQRKKIVLILTSVGSDPSAEIRDIADILAIKDPCFLSMGADYITKAETILTSSQAPFVCLTNLHFVVNWLNRLSKILIDLIESKKEPFVVLVSQCHENFPTSMLEMCVKYVYESAPGLKAHIASLNTDSSLTSIPEFKKVAHFHAICCERKHFVPLGWTKNYEFGFNDFRSALHVVEEVKKSRNRRLQLSFISGLLENVVYGGKIDTKADFKILQSLIKQWFSNLESRLEIDLKSTSEISALGLPANINLWKNAAVEERLTRGLQTLENAANFNNKKEELKTLQHLWRDSMLSQLCERSTPLSSSKSSPLRTFLVSEWNKVLLLVKTVENDLNDSKGETFDSLANNETPDSWFNLWSTGPLNANTFIRRLSQITKELNKNVDSVDLKYFDLSVILSVSSFLNALRQQASREICVNIDSIKICYFWGKQTSKLSNYYLVTLTGLVIEGALFDGTILTDCSSDSDLQSQLPPLYLYFVSKESSIGEENETVALPVYGRSTREDALFWFDVPCKPGSQNHWIQSAVALVIKSGN